MGNKTNPTDILMDKTKEPAEALKEYVEKTAFYAVSSREEVQKFVDKELIRQKKEGIIDKDADKISMKDAEPHNPGKGAKLFTGAAGLVIAGLIVAAVIVCIMLKNGQEPWAWFS